VKSNVVKFPAPEEQEIKGRIKRIIAKRDFLIDDYRHKVRRLNWFAGGFLFGLVLTLAVVSTTYYFVGAP